MIQNRSKFAAPALGMISCAGYAPLLALELNFLLVITGVQFVLSIAAACWRMRMSTYLLGTFLGAASCMFFIAPIAHVPRIAFVPVLMGVMLTTGAVGYFVGRLLLQALGLPKTGEEVESE